LTLNHGSLFAALPRTLLSVLAEKKNSFGPQDHKDPWAIFYQKIKQFFSHQNFCWAYGQKTTLPPKAF